MKLDLLTNATVVDHAFRFVSLNSKEKVLSTDNSGNESDDKEESNEPEYDEDKNQLEEEQEVETGKIMATTITTNQVF